MELDPNSEYSGLDVGVERMTESSMTHCRWVYGRALTVKPPRNLTHCHTCEPPGKGDIYHTWLLGVCLPKQLNDFLREGWCLSCRYLGPSFLCHVANLLGLLQPACSLPVCSQVEPICHPMHTHRILDNPTSLLEGCGGLKGWVFTITITIILITIIKWQRKSFVCRNYTSDTSVSAWLWNHLGDRQQSRSDQKVKH